MRSVLLLVTSGLLLLAPAFAKSARAEEKPVLHYRMKVRLEPSSHRLEAEVWIQHPPASRFYLHPGLSVQQVTADGKEVACRADLAAEQLPYLVGVPLAVEAQNPQQLYVKYRGEISEAVSGVNMVTPELEIGRAHV